MLGKQRAPARQRLAKGPGNALWATALPHPPLEKRLRGAPQIKLRVQGPSEPFDVKQRLLQQYEFGTDLHVELPRGLK